MKIFRTNPPDDTAGVEDDAAQPDNVEVDSDQDPLGMPGGGGQP